MANGGIIGTVNNPTSSTATGVWQQEEQYEAVRDGTWPQRSVFTTKSLRFNGGSSDYLTFTPSATPTGSAKTWTYSVWAKMAKENPGYFLAAGSGTQSKFIFGAYGGGDIDILTYEGYVIAANTARLFRDPSAWYHVVLACDTTQAVAANGIKLYINGVQQTLTFNSISGQNGYTQNTSLRVGTSGEPINIGKDINDSGYWNGYIAESILVDGQQLAPTSFGVANSDGVWTPIIYTGSYGNNGFNLQFENAAALGTDSSPNGNTFTANNLTSIDQSTDYPEVNYATANPLTLSTDATLTEGNLAITYGTASTRRAVFGTIAMFNGKWFWETKITATSQTAVEINLGISNTMNPALIGNALVSTNGFSVSYFTGGNIKIGTTTAQTGLGNLAVNDVIGCALDLTSNTIQFYKNGSTLGSAASLSSQTTGELGGGNSGGWTPAWSCSSGGQTFTAGVNFGSPSFAISSGNADGNGYGNFEYAVPSGFYAINTANLAEFG